MLDIEELEADFLFTRRPLTVPGDLRPVWKIGLLVLLLSGCCRSAKSSLARLHVLNWGVGSEKSKENLLAAIKGALRPQSVVVRFDPFLNRAVDFALGEGLVKRIDGSKVELTPKGKLLAKEIDEVDSTYVAEKRFIDIIRHGVSEALVGQMFSLWGN